MDSLSNWATSFCVVSVICAFASFLVPSGSVKKTVSVVMSLFMLSVVVVPFTGFDLSDFTELLESDFGFSEEIDEYSDDLYEYLLDNGKRITRESIAAELDAICNDKYDIRIIMEINDDGNPELTDIIITVSKNDSVKTLIIKSKIGSLTGVVPEVKTG